ncbi:MAG: 1-acyl-sn-glycerol-3-phosphate acyltransferase [Actinomycetota bacterium]
MSPFTGAVSPGTSSWSAWATRIGPGDPSDPLGAADCELLRAGEIAQPVNAASSAVLALVGLWLIVRAQRTGPGRWAATAFGVVTLLAGLGSVDYHGIQTDAAQWTHDGGAGLLVAVAISVPLWRVIRRRAPLPGWSRVRGVALLGAGAVALLAYAGGRTTVDLCDPESVLQLHGVWHLMIGVLAALWAGALWPVEVPAAAAEPEPSWGEHRFLYRLVRIAARLVWRDIDTDDLRDLADGPVLVVANHFGGLADALVLMSVLPRRPRILADDAIWRIPPARWVMNQIGAVAVHRGRSGSTDNSSMFATAAAALDSGDLLLVFPEGITRDEPSIGTVHTGAVRMAAAANVDVRIVAVGLHYADKAAFRSDVAVRRGGSVVVPADERPDDQAGIDALTARMGAELRAAAPDYDGWDEVAALRGAATVVLEAADRNRRVSIGERERLASAYAALPPAERVAVRQAAEEFLSSGATVVERRRSTPVARVLRAIVWVAALPYALVGAVVFGIPVLLTWGASRLPLAAAVRATIVPAVALLTFGGAAGVVVVTGAAQRGGDGVGLALSLVTVAFLALVYTADTAVGLFRSIQHRLGPRRDRRRVLVASIEAATGVAVDAGAGVGATVSPVTGAEVGR